MLHTWQHNVCIVFFVVILSALVATRSYNNGLIFYDLQTQQAFLPPTVSVSRGRGLANVKYSDKGSIWSTFGKPCHCAGAKCGCCAGIKVKQYNFNEKMCANVTFIHQKDEAILDIFLGDKPSARYGISARNPSPFCIPVMLGIPMAMCVQMSNIAIQGNNLNMCMDFIVRLATTDLFEMHFQCMRMGLDGIQYLDKNGQPVLPPGGQLIKYGGEEEAEDEQSAEYSEYYDESPAANENEIETSENKLENDVSLSTMEEQQVEKEQDETKEGYNGEQIALETENLIVTTLAPADAAVYDNSVGDYDGEEVDSDDSEDDDGYFSASKPTVANVAQVNVLNNYAPEISEDDDQTNEEIVEHVEKTIDIVATTTTTTTASPALAAYNENAAAEAATVTDASDNTSADTPSYTEVQEIPNVDTVANVAVNYVDNVATEVVDVSVVSTEPTPYVTVATATYEQLQPISDDTIDAVTASTSLAEKSTDATVEATSALPKSIKLSYRRFYG